jgi:hypothetical protein
MKGLASAAVMAVRLLLLLATGVAGTTLAAGSSVSKPAIKIFRGLIVEGERPEISACLTVALQEVRTATAWQALSWTQRMTDQAVLREAEAGPDRIRETTIRLMATPRQSAGLHLGSATPVRVRLICDQVNEGRPGVRILADE